jgi:hypothetical protein
MKMSLMVLVLGDTLDGEMLATERPTGLRASWKGLPCWPGLGRCSPKGPRVPDA